MRILICSHSYGNSAEGICVQRLTKALLSAGCQIELVTGGEAARREAGSDCVIHYIDEGASALSRFYNALARRLHLQPYSSLVWARRVRKVSLVQEPDMIYGRAWPLASLQGAVHLHRRYRRPWTMHLSDPLPSPWDLPGSRPYRAAVRWMNTHASSCRRMTFVTREALEFQERAMNMSIASRAFVLNHVAPASAHLPAKPLGGTRVLTYVGSFYGHRMPDALLLGFKHYLATHGPAELHFAGTDPVIVGPAIRRQGLESSVKILPRTTQVERHLAESDLLIAVDAFHGAPVFISTKLVEYLMVNRPVLLISPPGSSGTKLLSNMPVSRVVTEEDPAVIAAAMHGLLTSAGRAGDYERRWQMMEPFGGPAVARRFLDEMETALRQPNRDRVADMVMR